jgi:hypothetical protein
MQPSSLLSYYPTYAILDEILSYNKYRNLNIFIDLKNNLQTAYMEHAIVNIVENSKKADFFDSSVFSAVVSFLSFHKMYAVKRGINTTFTIFFETGQSYYHQNISKSYKISRKIDNLYGLDVADRDLFFTVMQANYQLIESALNKVPTVNVIRMNHMEADFIPYYLLSRNKMPNDGSVAHVIYSNDHDMWQCIQPHCYIFSKSAKHKKIIKSGVMDLYFKKEVKIPDEYYPLAMAIIGDTGDDVTGVSGVGPTGFIEMFPELLALVGTMDEVYEKVEKGENIFKFMPENIQNKKLKKVYDEENEKKTVSKNLKLVSFELISRFLESPKTTEIMERRNKIDKILQEKQVYPADSIKTALTKTGVFLEDASIDLLYI